MTQHALSMLPVCCCFTHTRPSTTPTMCASAASPALSAAWGTCEVLTAHPGYASHCGCPHHTATALQREQGSGTGRRVGWLAAAVWPGSCCLWRIQALPATGPASAHSRVHRPPHLACSALTRRCVASVCVCVTPVFSWHCLASGSLADMAKESVAEGSYIQVSGTYLVRESLQVRGHRSCRGGVQQPHYGGHVCATALRTAVLSHACVHT